MINCSRLLRVMETREEVKKHLGKEAREVPKHLIRYSRSRAPMVIWNITRKCNLCCPVCHLGSAPEASDEELSTREAKDLIDQMASMGVPLVSVYGGEPLTRSDFLELAGYAHQKGLRMIFSTNATLITRKKAAEIRDYLRRNRPRRPCPRRQWYRRYARVKKGSRCCSTPQGGKPEMRGEDYRGRP
jgi:uncharacterized radical SAM superfamily Fe-S cluster-containing enzyme